MCLALSSLETDAFSFMAAPPESSDPIRHPEAPLIERLDQDLGLGVGITVSSCSLFLSPSPSLCFYFAASEGSRREKGRGEGSVPCACSLRGLTFSLASSSSFSSPWIFFIFFICFFLVFSCFVYGGRLVYLCGLTMTVVRGFAGLTTIKPRIFFQRSPSTRVGLIGT